jgi:protein gp37
MSDTKIEWAEKTWNPITGCTKISEGCKNCYAERMSKRLAGRYGYPKDKPFAVTFHEDRLQEPLKWRNPSMIFVCSMGDLFHDDVETKWLDKVFAVMALCPQHTFLLLTKRPENMQKYITSKNKFGDSSICKAINDIPASLGNRVGCLEIPFSNVWLGVTAENQREANNRIPILLETPTIKRFVSIEPMLEFISLDELDVYRSITQKIDSLSGYHFYPEKRATININKLDWIICGGETGQKARQMQVEWARNLRDQCKYAGVPFFFKKLGQGKETPQDLMIREYPNE